MRLTETGITTGEFIGAMPSVFAAIGTAPTANDGNITVRVSDNEVLCTPTMHCKGFLKPDDIATVDMTGKQIAGRDVVLFMKGTKSMPQCGFSMQVAQILSHLGVDFADINVLDDMSVREGVKAYSNWPTIPQLYVKGEFVGGCDIVREMFQAGELQEMLKTKGIANNAQTATA